MAMNVIEIDRQLERPPDREGELQLWPRAAFYVTTLLERGPGVIFAEPAPDEDPVVWRYRSFVTDRGTISHRAATEPTVVDHLPRGLFRPVLARLAHVLLPGDNLYGGSGRFQVKFRDEPAPRDAFLFMYLANEPAIGTWVRLHWYGPWRPPRSDDDEIGRKGAG